MTAEDESRDCAGIFKGYRTVLALWVMVGAIWGIAWHFEWFLDKVSAMLSLLPDSVWVIGLLAMVVWVGYEILIRPLDMGDEKRDN